MPVTDKAALDVGRWFDQDHPLHWTQIIEMRRAGA
jgi:hypothetical protein